MGYIVRTRGLRKMGANAKFSPLAPSKTATASRSFPSPIEVRPLNPAIRGSKALPSGVWSGAPAEIEFGAF